MKLLEMLNRPGPDVLVLFAGRFQPIHRGHRAVFMHLVKTFGSQVFIATSNIVKLPNSPFNFEEKVWLATKAGIPEKHVRQTASPYRPQEITDDYDPDHTILIFALGAKDSDRFDLDEPDSDRYMQPFESIGRCQAFAKHGYIYIVPTVEFDIDGETVQSASEIREMYAQSDKSQRSQIIQDLYGYPDPEIQQLFDQKLVFQLYETQQLQEVKLPKWILALTLGTAMLSTPNNDSVRNIDSPKIARVDTAYIKNLQMLALTIWGEARNQSEAGMRAIGHVIVNRSKSKNTNIENVVLAPHQFSCWDSTDQNKEKILNMNAIDQYIREHRAPNGVDFDEWYAELQKTSDWQDYQAWQKSFAIAQDIMNGRSQDPTRGATYYHSKHVKHKPFWTHVSQKVAEIGDHVFYKPMAGR